MKLKTTIKAGLLTMNHNEKLVPAKRGKKNAVKTGVRAGISWGGGVGDASLHGSLSLNHNEKLVRAKRAR